MWEKAGVNISVVYGSMPPEAYRAATGVKSEVKKAVRAEHVPWRPNRCLSRFRGPMKHHVGIWLAHVLGSAIAFIPRCYTLPVESAACASCAVQQHCDSC